MPSKPKPQKARQQPKLDFWNVVEIVDEDEVEGKYKVIWEGINPETGKPWPRDWVPYEDCTASLVAEWRRKKARGDALAKKKKPTRRTGSGTSIQSRTSAGSSASTSAGLRSTASTESTRKLRANKLASQTAEGTADARPSKRRKLVEPEGSKPLSRSKSEDKAEFLPTPRSPQKPHSAELNGQGQARVESPSDGEDVMRPAFRKPTKRKRYVIETQPTQDADVGEAESRLPAASSEFELEPELSQPMKFGPPRPSKIIQETRVNGGIDSPFTSSSHVEANPLSQATKYGPPKRSKKPIQTKSKSPTSTPSAQLTPTPEPVFHKQLTVEIPSPPKHNSKSKGKARPNPWSSPATDALEVSEAELESPPSPPRKRKLPRKPSPSSKTSSKASSRSGSKRSEPKPGPSNGRQGDETPMTRRLRQWEEEVRYEQGNGTEEPPPPKPKPKGRPIPSRANSHHQDANDSVVPETDAEESTQGSNKAQGTKSQPPTNGAAQASNSQTYLLPLPVTVTAEAEEVQEEIAETQPIEQPTTQPLSSSTPPPLKQLKPVPYISPSQFSAYLPPAPATQDSGSASFDPISQFSSPSKSQRRRAQKQEQIETSLDEIRPQDADADMTIDDSNEMVGEPQARKEEEEESTQDLLEDIRVQQEEEGTAQDLLAAEEAALTQDLLSLENSEEEEDEDEGEQIYFPSDVIHSFEAGYMPPHLDDDSMLIPEPIIEAEHSIAALTGRDYDLLHPEDEEEQVESIQSVRTINPALLEPSQDAPQQYSPERSPSLHPNRSPLSSPVHTMRTPSPPHSLHQPTLSPQLEPGLVAQLQATITQLQSDLLRETARVKFAQSEETSIRHAYISVSQNHTDIVRELNSVRSQLEQSDIEQGRAEKRAKEGVQGVKAFYADMVAKLKEDVEKLRSELAFVKEKEKRTDADGIRKKAMMHDEMQFKLRAQTKLSDELVFERRQTEMKLDELQVAFGKLQANYETLLTEKEAVEEERGKIQAENESLLLVVDDLQLKAGRLERETEYYFCGHADGCRRRFDTYEELETHWNEHLAEDFPEVHDEPKTCSIL